MARFTEVTVQELPLGITLVEDGDGFILRCRQADGEISVINLTEDEFWRLRGAIAFWTNRLLSQRQAPTSEFETVIAQSVTRARVLPDAMSESVLLIVEAPTGEQITLKLPPHVATFIADQVPTVLSNMTTGPWH